MTKPTTQNLNGFIALISVIIISTILLLVATTLNLSGYYGRYNILESELKERGNAIAEACAETALFKLTSDTSYSPTNESITVSGDTCVIRSVVAIGTQRIISIQSNYKNYFTNLKIVIDVSNFSIISWEEVPFL